MDGSREGRSVGRRPVIARRAGWRGRSGLGLRLTGAGGGTALPGTVLDRMSPGYLERRVRAFPDGVVVVSRARTGRRRPRRCCGRSLRAAGIETAGNESGSNLRRGSLSALIETPPSARLGVFEVDEAALPALMPELRPRSWCSPTSSATSSIGTARRRRSPHTWRAAMRALPPGAQVVANADDPLLWNRAREHDGAGFGVEPIPGAEARRPTPSPRPARGAARRSSTRDARSPTWAGRAARRARGPRSRRSSRPASSSRAAWPGSAWRSGARRSISRWAACTTRTTPRRRSPPRTRSASRSRRRPRALCRVPAAVRPVRGVLVRRASGVAAADEEPRGRRRGDP